MATASYGHGPDQTAGTPSFQSFFFIIVIKILSGNSQFKAKYKILLLSQLGVCLRHRDDMSDLFFTVFSVAKGSSCP